MTNIDKLKNFVNKLYENGLIDSNIHFEMDNLIEDVRDNLIELQEYIDYLRYGRDA